MYTVKWATFNRGILMNFGMFYLVSHRIVSETLTVHGVGTLIHVYQNIFTHGGALEKVYDSWLSYQGG